jgi:hypothetical protein
MWRRERRNRGIRLPLSFGMLGAGPNNRKDGFPLGGGEMGALVRAPDWSKTTLGPISDWPAHLPRST